MTENDRHLAVCQNQQYPCSSHQNSWVKMDVHLIKKGIFIGIDPQPSQVGAFQSSSRAFFSLLPGCGNSTELARFKTGKISSDKNGKFQGNPHGGLECLDIDGDITLLRMFRKFRNHWVFFFTSPRAELKHSEISSTPQNRNLFSKPLGGASQNCPRWRPKRCWGIYFQKSPVNIKLASYGWISQ